VVVVDVVVVVVPVEHETVMSCVTVAKEAAIVTVADEEAVMSVVELPQLGTAALNPKSGTTPKSSVFVKNKVQPGPGKDMELPSKHNV